MKDIIEYVFAMVGARLVWSQVKWWWRMHRLGRVQQAEIRALREKNDNDERFIEVIREGYRDE